MKNKKQLLALLFLAVAMVFVLLLPARLSKSVGNPSKSGLGLDKNTSADRPGVRSNQSDAKSSTRPGLEDQLRQVATDSNRPITFYGLVLDQNDNPVPEVTVSLQVRHTVVLGPVAMRDEFIDLVRTTGPDGRFTLTDSTGALLTVKAIEKKGYEPSEKALRSSYWYWAEPRTVYHPKADAPEVFRVWKKAGAERLTRRPVTALVRYDGTPTTVNLRDSQADSPGDLRVMLRRNPFEIADGQKNFSWSVTLEGLNGCTIQETAAEQMYLAPQDGYSNQLFFSMPSDAPDWAERRTFKLYLRLENGKTYARAEVRVSAGGRQTEFPVYVTALLNTSGSRNLEYDPAQELGAP